MKEILYFIGKNNTKKTTVIKILLGLLKPTTGETTVLILNSLKNNFKTVKRTRHLIETPIFYEHLSVVDNLKIYLGYMNMKETNIENIMEIVKLLNVAKQPISTFLFGIRQRLGQIENMEV